MLAPANDNAIDCPRLALRRREAYATQRRLMRAKPPPRQSGDGPVCQDQPAAYATHPASLASNDRRTTDG
jgi:hypothetical protein